MPKLPALWSELPEPFRGRLDPERPWDLLGSALDEALAALPSERIEVGLSPDVHLIGDRIVIGKGTRILPGAVIEGPIYIGAAYLRGGVWLEDGALVGANTEVKRAILLAGAKAPHLPYVGDSILGRDVNLGAGTILSNFRHDGAEIVIPWAGGRLATGCRKLGALLGDSVQTGCNCVLHPGSIVGARTALYPGVQLRSGVVPAGVLVKLRQELEIIEVEN